MSANLKPDVWRTHEVELAQERIELERKRSLVLPEVSRKVGATHEKDDVLDVIVNYSARLLSVPIASFRPVVKFRGEDAPTDLDVDPETAL